MKRGLSFALFQPFAGICVAVVCSAAVAVTNPPNGEPGTVRSVTELRLPEYQADMMAPDLPASDVLVASNGIVWVLGKRAVWSWQLEPFKLQRLPLHDRSKDPTPLARLGTDGVNLFAASARTLYQVDLEQSRTFRYRIPGATQTSHTLGFSGRGADFWLLHESGFWRFDPHSQKLGSRLTPVAIAPSDAFTFNGTAKALWIAHEKTLQRVDWRGGAPRTTTVLKAKHKLRGVQISGSQLVLNTEHTVLRLDQSSGKLKQSVPVEGSRRLTASAIDGERHVYLFDDRLLEVFTLATRSAARYRLPLDASEEVTHLVLDKTTLALLVDGRPRVFRLDGLTP